MHLLIRQFVKYPLKLDDMRYFFQNIALHTSLCLTKFSMIEKCHSKNV